MDSATSGSSKKSQVLLQHMKSSHSKFSQDSNGSHSGISSRSSHTEKRIPKLALSEVNAFNKFSFPNIKHVKFKELKLV
jgi:hypothetical protein